MNNDIDSPTHQNTVIVADNSATLRFIITKALEKNYNVIEATSGGQVASLIDMARSSGSSDVSPDIIDANNLAILIIGFELSGGRGLEIITELRQVYNKQELPIILNTSDNRRENIKNAITAGINDYIVKPFAAELLVAKIRNLSTRTPQHSLDLSLKICQIPFFKDIPEHVVAHALFKCATISDLDVGSVICTQDESNFDLFILMEGGCDVLYHDRKVSVISPIDTIGEMGFLENEKRSATVVANQPSNLVTFDKDKFENFLNEDRAVSEIICKNVIHTLSERIKKSNKLLERLTKSRQKKKSRLSFLSRD
jgi:DNA-binding response OmpR family regulator